MILEYDPYRGVISSIRIVDGVVKAGDKIRMMATGKEFEVTEVGSIHLSSFLLMN
ncbi:EF-Tu/IF-2/RF-3 family GTPase [Staphylococcus aureus]